VVGSSVVTTFGNVGTIEKMDKETAEVLVGGMRLRQKLADLQAVEVESKVQSPKSKAGVAQSALDLGRETLDPSAELNLIGKTTAEADYELDRFIDEAYMASLPRVRIIHGFGTGALKNFVHHFLKNHELVERFAFASSDQGGNGATVAEIKI
jgi:DNA mismatch repair protein MutS2